MAKRKAEKPVDPVSDLIGEVSESGKWEVSCPALGGKPVEVEAETREEAVEAFRGLCQGLNSSAVISAVPVEVLI